MATGNDTRRKELEQIEKQKAIIKRTGPRRALLWNGLCNGPTLAAIRLTFWDLSWDVMDPICFFVTTIHFNPRFAFFIRTSTEPTFQGYFQRRFVAKQKRLVGISGFDVEKYTQLRKALYPTSSDHLHRRFHHEGGNFIGAVSS